MDRVLFRVLDNLKISINQHTESSKELKVAILVLADSWDQPIG